MRFLLRRAPAEAVDPDLQMRNPREPRSPHHSAATARRNFRTKPATSAPPAAPVMTYPTGNLHQANPMRLSVAHELGRDIDGAWWPRTQRIHYELPPLVAVLKPMLGDVSSVRVSWPPLQRPPDEKIPVR
jgi:hypothetical protein